MSELHSDIRRSMYKAGDNVVCLIEHSAFPSVIYLHDGVVKATPSSEDETVIVDVQHLGIFSYKLPFDRVFAKAVDLREVSENQRVKLIQTDKVVQEFLRAARGVIEFHEKWEKEDLGESFGIP